MILLIQQDKDAMKVIKSVRNVIREDDECTYIKNVTIKILVSPLGFVLYY